MKCLFVLREKQNGKLIPNMEFDNKMKAKAARDEIGGSTVVSKGRDHQHYEPNKGEK